MANKKNEVTPMFGFAQALKEARLLVAAIGRMPLTHMILIAAAFFVKELAK